MPKNLAKIETHKVFGVSNEYVDSYIQRIHVDESFRRGLTTNKHIIVYGASKQGKTSLTNEHLKDDEFVRIDCSPNTTLIDIYKSILRQLDVEFEESRSESTIISGSPNISAKVKLKIPFIGEAEVEGGGEGLYEKNNEFTYSTIEYNLVLAQDVSEILNKIDFKGRVLLENFHYLGEEEQKQFAFDLRIFEDQNILFVILGIWRERNRLSQYNGDLLDRLVEIPVEPWTKKDFIRVLKEGEPFLNITFNQIQDDIVNTSYGSIGVLQELCKHSCYFSNVEHTQEVQKIITSDSLVKAINRKVEDYASRHIRCIEVFIEQRNKTTQEGEQAPLMIPYYFIRCLFAEKFENIHTGISRKDIQRVIRENHHRGNDVRSSDLSNFLYNIVARQVRKKITPPIFDYDRSTQTLRIIDSTFYFYINNCDSATAHKLLIVNVE